jgi:cell division protease FtsH
MKKERPPKAKGERRAPSGSFILFLLLALFIALTVQNFLTSKSAKVSFAYQVQHLVNLQLIQPQDSRMTAQSNNLVTFYGRFRERTTDEGQKRFQYLQLLDKQEGLKNQKLDLASDIANDRKSILLAADTFLHLSGLPLPAGGYEVVRGFSTISEDVPAVVLESLSPRKVTSLVDLEHQFAQLSRNPADSAVEAFGQQLSDLLAEFRSAALGIGADDMKNQLATLDKNVGGVNVSTDGVAPALKTYGAALEQLGAIVTQLNTWEEGARLTQIRSVRGYGEDLQAYADASVQFVNNTQTLDQARNEVAEVVWYFGNQELSSRRLEQQDPDLLNQWYQQASQEWAGFDANKGLPFKAVDQPRNLVLEKNFRSQAPTPNYLSYLMPVLLVVGVIGLLYFVFARQMKGVGSSAMNFGKSPAKLFNQGMTNVTFDDVAGCEEAKEELQEIVDFLKNPSRFTALGGEIPKGVLCVGPPGTGKTLIAKAVAGEANRPFFSISGSDFVEMFVGVGASRIRDLFAEAKKHAPCIVFIDEIDAVGRHRGAGIGGGHDEREQTLNQLLVEMDGFDTNEGVILVAATNRPDVLDRALLRPGRFDRRVVIDLPDIKGRLEILKVHARKIKIDPSVDLMAIARNTPGSSGADLRNLLNEAALLAARKGRTAVTIAEANEACDKVRYGKERRSLELDAADKKCTAYHESGHAVVGLVCEHSDPVDKVTIIPRGFSLGATHFMPEKNRHTYWKQELYDYLAVTMGGRVAEEIFVGDVSSGAKQDIRQATDIARSMVCEWGMSDEVGLVAYTEQGEGGQYLGVGGYQEKPYSERTAQSIDSEVHRLTQEAYERAKKIVQEHRAQLELMAEMLMEFETLDAQDVDQIMKGQWDSEAKRRKLKEIEELRKVPTPQPPVHPEEGKGNDHPSSSEIRPFMPPDPAI